MHQIDVQLQNDNIRKVRNRDDLAGLFTTLGYKTDARQTQSADTMGITQKTIKDTLKHAERIAAHETLEVYLFETTTVTLAQRRMFATALNNKGGDYLFVHTDPDYNRLDFVLIERFEKGKNPAATRAQPLPLAGTGSGVQARPPHRLGPRRASVPPLRDRQAPEPA